MKAYHLISILGLLIGAQSHAQVITSEADHSSWAVDENATQLSPSVTDDSREIVRPRPEPARPVVRPTPAPHPVVHPGPRPVVHPRPIVHPGSHPYPRPNPHPGMGHGRYWGHPGWHDGGPRPGWRFGWDIDYRVRPFWFYDAIVFPRFVFVAEVQRNYYQCTAFDENRNPYSASAPTRQEAAYNALYDCGGPDYADECYVPEGFCQLRL